MDATALDDRLIPPLRADVVLEEDPRGGRMPFAAVDRPLGQKVRLDPRGMAVASALDRPRTGPELSAVLEHMTGMRFAPELLVRFVRFLDGHCLLAGERAERRRAALDAADARPDGITFLGGTQHECVACGHSCEAHDVGPIDPAQVVAAEALNAGGRFVRRQTNDAETTGHYCAMEGDRCTFLRPDHLCRIHALGGVAPKPTDCRVFPLAFTRTPAGVVAGVRLECRSYLQSKRNGGALAERGVELSELYGHLPSVSEVAPLVRLDGAVTLPYSEWLPIRAELLAAVEQGPPVVWAGLAALNARACQLLAAARDADTRTWVYPPDPDAPTGAPREAVVAALVDGCEMAARMNAAGGNPLRAERLTRVARAAGRLGSPPEPATMTDDEDELLRDHLRQSLFLEDALQGPHVRFGLAVLNVSVLAAVAGRAEADHLNGALADTLKALRAGPVQSRLAAVDEPLAEWFFDRLATSA